MVQFELVPLGTSQFFYAPQGELKHIPSNCPLLLSLATETEFVERLNNVTHWCPTGSVSASPEAPHSCACGRTERTP